MFEPVSAEVAGGLAAAAGERVALGATLCGADVGDGTATVCVGVSDRVAVAEGVVVTGVVLAAGEDVAVGALVPLGAGDAPVRLAHAFVSCVSTERQMERALDSHAEPSAAVRESDSRMNG